MLEKRLKEELKGVKILLTRRDDVFISLYDRARFANEKNGDIFISYIIMQRGMN
jgi:N-acetylmuramoyl-L-alanine amidase